ncbi:ATP-binding protein [Desulfoluna butyratoxydans]|uniref:4fe-4s ferredoxin-type iron-sulphur binding domain n=1 Tax=Desulfoluna butyratoxydans TaxID=231438 RepID=A0A4U8YU87_9BACT|nr:4Fe-4S binding protein [Desulfoluna butyratoxydans]VFQ46969.1 4fe-4s ferredoxin-type iron-sulphur binding domain [Desulfoluna butyratoxydans]
MDKDAYIIIAERMNRNPMRVPRVEGEFTPSFIEYLKLVYTPEEAEVVRHLDVLPAFVTFEQVAEATGLSVEEVGRRIESAHHKNALVGMGTMFCLPPIPVLLNLHHFYSDLREDDLEAITLYRDFFIDKGYGRYYETSEAGSPVFRTIPVEEAIRCGEKVMTSEEAHSFVESLSTEDFVMVPCPCRTRAEKAGDRECRDKFPIGSCIMIGFTALHFESIGLGKRVTREQALSYMDEMIRLGLVPNTENVEKESSTICLCCECCCSQVRGRTRWDNPESISPSNFVPRANDDCVMCGQCLERCFFGALSLDEEAGKAVADPTACIGCGVCTFACEAGALKLERFERSTPFASTGKMLKAFQAENTP